MVRCRKRNYEPSILGPGFLRARGTKRKVSTGLLREADSTVLINGESGTGKELVARALQETSHRAPGPFVAVNCAAIPSELLESELFGHVRGAFTGAVRDQSGRLELAHSGTLFLDEIGDLAPNFEAKFLRFLQEHTFDRVGEARTRKVDVRLNAATHVNLVTAVEERRFREDLYYGLRVVPIEIPPIRERRQDLELLIRHFLEKIGREHGRSLRLAASASRALLTYSWPRNVRELESALEYAVSVCEGQTIHTGDLQLEIERLCPGGTELEGSTAAPQPSGTEPCVRSEPPGPADLERDTPPMADGAEAERICAALERTKYSRGTAADLLGISRTTLWRKMKRCRL